MDFADFNHELSINTQVAGILLPETIDLPLGGQFTTYSEDVIIRNPHDRIVFSNCIFKKPIMLQQVVTEKLVFKKCLFEQGATINGLHADKFDVMDCYFQGDLNIFYCNINNILLAGNSFEDGYNVSFKHTVMQYLLA